MVLKQLNCKFLSRTTSSKCYYRNYLNKSNKPSRVKEETGATLTRVTMQRTLECNRRSGLPDKQRCVWLITVATYTHASPKINISFYSPVCVIRTVFPTTKRRPKHNHGIFYYETYYSGNVSSSCLTRFINTFFVILYTSLAVGFICCRYRSIVIKII